MSEYAAQLLRRIEAIDNAAADNRRRAEAYQRMEEGLKETEARTTSPDGVVTVVVGPGGVLKEIAFSERVREIPPATLSATVQQTVSAATAQVARQQAEVVRQGLGSTELLDRVIETDQRLFGDQSPADVPAAAVSGTASRHEAGQDESFEDIDFIRGSGR